MLSREQRPPWRQAGAGEGSRWRGRRATRARTEKSRRRHVFGTNPNSEMSIKLCKKALRKIGLAVMAAEQVGWHLSKAVDRFVRA